MLKITEVTKTGFEVMLWSDLDEFCTENSFPILDDIVLNTEYWPCFENEWEYEFEIEIFWKDSIPKLTILADLKVEADMSFEIFWDEDYIVSKLHLLNWEF